jgi:hypothetical protein
LIITIIAVRVFLVDNCYNCIWIDRRFFQSFLSGFTIAISARTKIFPLANTPNHQNTAINAAMGLHDDGKTGGVLNSWRQYAKSGDIIFYQSLHNPDCCC